MIQIDIQMPERCGVCFAMHNDEIGLESWCGIDETARDLCTADIMTKRPEWCPLKEQETKWIHREDMDFIDKYNCTHFHGMCTNCGLVHDFIDGHTGQYLYCPQCGKAVQWK